MAQNILNKYIWLADTIYSAGNISLKEINSKWLRSNLSNEKPLTRRTFHNHKIAIEEIFDINIGCNPITNEYYIEDIEEFGKNELIKWLLNSFSISNLIQESKDIKGRIILDEVPSAQSFLAEIIKAIRENKIIIMTYHPFWSPTPLEIEFYPYFVKLFNRRWYVYGRTETEDKVKVYALDRIKKLTATNRKFVFPVDFVAAKFLNASIGIMKTDSEKPCKINIKAYAETTQYLLALPLHHSQKVVESTKDYTIFSYWLSPTDDFYQEILRKREYLEVVSPQAVRDELSSIIHKLSEYYL
jgi:WYL domain